MSGRHILVVEDDPSITLGLQMNLEAEGYRVSVASDGQAGLAQARQGDVDLLILDVMLPKLNGFELLRQLRSEGCAIPTIVLSARDTELDIVMGLDFGAEDYVTKPFGLAELLARIKVVLRRATKPEAKSVELSVDVTESTSGQTTQEPEVDVATARPRGSIASRVCSVGPLKIDSGSRQVTRHNLPISLTATEFDILWCLVEGAGRVLSREAIQTQVWGPEHHGTLRTIDNFMMQLRTKLESDPTEPETLLTVRGVGYRLNL